MQIPIAYISVILIWSTTPLAIKWSAEGVGYLFAVTSRMDIGFVIALLLSVMMGLGLPLHRKAVLTYLASGIGGSVSLLLAYISLQTIPSGWLSVIFGLSPILTSIVATLFLNEGSVGLRKTGALLISLCGLSVIFQQGMDMGDAVGFGMLAAVGGAIAYALTLVAVKAIEADIKPTSSMTGTLAVCAIIFTSLWLVSGADLPLSIPSKAAGAILYLGIIGSVLGFMLFYFLLQNIPATKVALVTLITPITALLLGNLLNDEQLTLNILSGSLLVLFGLILFEFDYAIVRLATWSGISLKLKKNKL